MMGGGSSRARGTCWGQLRAAAELPRGLEAVPGARTAEADGERSFLQKLDPSQRGLYNTLVTLGSLPPPLSNLT